MKKTVIFDLDGTLINSLPDISAAMNRALVLEGLSPWPEDAYRYFVGDGVINLSRRAAGTHTDRASRLAELYIPYYHEHSRDNTYVYPGITETLETLTAVGMSVSVFTNKDQPDAEDVLGHFFPGIRFACIQGRRPDLPIKPDPTAVRLILERVGCGPEEAWYVGDTATDMRCGKNAGIETVGVLWGFRTREELSESGAEHIVSSPAQLGKLFL